MPSKLFLVLGFPSAWFQFFIISLFCYAKFDFNVLANALNIFFCQKRGGNALCFVCAKRNILGLMKNMNRLKFA